MNWPWRVIVFVPVESQSAAEAAARGLNSTGPDYAGSAFTLRLSQSGQEPATYVGLYTSATQGMIEGMHDALPLLPGVLWWRHDDNGSLAASNVTEPAGQLWGMNASLEACGLLLISQP